MPCGGQRQFINCKHHLSASLHDAGSDPSAADHRPSRHACGTLGPISISCLTTSGAVEHISHGRELTGLHSPDRRRSRIGLSDWPYTELREPTNAHVVAEGAPYPGVRRRHRYGGDSAGRGRRHSIGYRYRRRGMRMRAKPPSRSASSPGRSPARGPSPARGAERARAAESDRGGGKFPARVERPSGVSTFQTAKMRGVAGC